MSELQGDFEDYLVQNGNIPWSIHDSNHQAVMAIRFEAFEYTEDLLHDYWVFLLKEKQKFDPWLEQSDDITAANALILLIQRATGLLGRQLTRLESDFVASGGIREKMTAARLESRADPDAPTCPDCDAHMIKRRSAKGPFWGCSNYPKCHGIREVTP